MRNSLTILRWVVVVVLWMCALAIAQTAPVPAPAVERPGVVGNDAFAAGKPLQEAHEKAALIRLTGEVNDEMLKSLVRRVDVARKAGCSLIIYEIDTYGGMVTSAIEISKFTKKLPGEHLNTVAWVHEKAFSAGSLIAASCQQIVVSSRASIGDCAPIIVSGDTLIPMEGEERKKMESPIVQEFEDSAKVNGHNPVILRAFVMSAMEVHEMHNLKTGETRFVDKAGKTALLDEPAKDWQYVGTIDNDQQLLTMGADTAIKVGLAKAMINDEADLKAAMNVRGELLVLDFSWAERTTVFLSLWWIRLMLFVGMLVFAWIEFSHPGISVAGVAAVLCLIFLVVPPFLIGLAQVWEIAFIVLGIGIIVADLVAFGGLGMLAVPGFILMAIGLVASFVPAEPGGGWVPTMNSTWVAVERGLGVLVGGTFLAIVGFLVLSRYLSMTPGFNRIQLRPTPMAVGAGVGGSSVRDALDQPADDAVFVGAIGVSTTDLRPSGKARFGEHLIDVVTDGGFIERGGEVVVFEIAGTRVVVKRHKGAIANGGTFA